MILNKKQVAIPKVVFYLAFKADNSRDAETFYNRVKIIEMLNINMWKVYNT
jgi:hypothetical protein